MNAHENKDLFTAKIISIFELIVAKQLSDGRTGKIDAGKGKVLLGAGPYLGFVLGGKTRQDLGQSNPLSIAGLELEKGEV